MSRGKSVTKLLIDSSKSALFAGIEIHNKPHIDYRYPTVVILIINAWELALKAYVYKFIGKKKIYENDGKHTINFSKALVLTRDHINSLSKRKFTAIAENLDLLNQYRCSNVHYANSNLDPIIFMLVSKAVLNYDTFLKTYFKKDITKDDNLIILPVGFKLPFDPIEYLLQDYGKTSNDYVISVINAIRSLNNDKIKESIVIGFDVFTANIKKIENADIVAAIDQENASFRITKTYQYTDDPSAPRVRVEEPILPPLTYRDVQNEVKKRRSDIKFDKKFNAIMKSIKTDKSLCQSNYLDPINKKGGKKDFYMESVIDVIIEKYDDN